MKLRFEVFEPVSTGSPDYIICGQASSSVNTTNLDINIKVAGTEVYDTSDLNADVVGAIFPVGPVVTSVGNVTVDYANQKLIVNIPLSQVWDDTVVTLEVSKTGYISYSNSFTVYGYDLGNDTTGGITENPDFDIYLINETDNVVGGVQTKPFAAFIGYRRPFTSRINLYSAASHIGGTFVYLNASNNVVMLGTENGFCCNKESIGIQQVFSLGAYGVCNSSTITFAEQTMFPEMDVQVACNPCEDNGCITLDSTNEATTYLDYTVIDLFYKDDVEDYPYGTHDLIYTIYDPQGVEVSLGGIGSSYTLTISPDPYTYVPTNFTYSGWQMPEVGDYVLKVTVHVDSTEDVAKCEQYVTLPSCHWFEVLEDATCATYTIHNRTFTDLPITVEVLNDSKQFVAYTPFTETEIEQRSTLTFTPTTDNVYKISVTRSGNTHTKILLHYCALKTCVKSYLNALICADVDVCSCGKTTCDCGNKSMFEFNAFVAEIMTYLHLLGEEYTENTIFTALSQTQIDDLYTLSQLTERFDDYCANCETLKICC